MPRLKAVKAEIGTTGNIERFELSRDAASDIAEAVSLEHSCDNPSCDIDAANEAGYPYSAAYLLAGATETPLLEAVCQAHGFNPSSTYDAIPDWAEWVAYFEANARECSSCGAFGFDAADNQCGNCLASLV